MTHYALNLHPDTNDLFLTRSGSLAVCLDAEAVAIHIKNRLMTFKGEWFLDTEAGVPWLLDIMGKAYDPALAEAVVKAEILNTHGVVEITSFSVAFISNLRKLDIRQITVKTDSGMEVSV